MSSFGEMSMKIREVYIKELKIRLKQFDTRISDLHKRFNSVEYRKRKDYLSTLDVLNDKKFWIAEDIKDLRLVGESEWRMFKDDIEDDFKALDREYRKAVASFH